MRKTYQLERKASKVLRELGVEQEPVDVIDVAHALGARVQYEVADHELSGVLYRSHDSLPIIGVNGRHHLNRQRFTIAHEIGHLLLHDEPIFIDHVFRRDQLSSEAVDPREMEANGFAAALLMPKEFVLRSVKGERLPLRSDVVEGMAARFGVSSQAMAFRLENLNVPLEQA